MEVKEKEVKDYKKYIFKKNRQKSLDFLCC